MFPCSEFFHVVYEACKRIAFCCSGWFLGWSDDGPGANGSGSDGGRGSGVGGSDDVGGVCLPVIVESNEAERAAQVESGAFQLCFVVQVLEPCRVANACEGGNVEGRVECNG